MVFLHYVGLTLEALGVIGVFLAFTAAYHSSRRMYAESRASLAQRLTTVWYLYDRNLSEEGLQHRSDYFRYLLWMLVAFAVLAAGFVLWQWAAPPPSLTSRPS
jgi:hypothetical protein